jgi:hypothetical protein
VAKEDFLLRYCDTNLLNASTRSSAQSAALRSAEVLPIRKRIRRLSASLERVSITVQIPLEARARNIACLRLHASTREIQSNFYSSDVAMMYDMTGE